MKRRNTISYIFGIGIILAGLLFNYLGIGPNGLFSFSTVGNFVIYIGIISLVITSLQVITKKQRKTDERMMSAALQSGRITLVLIILAAFIIMIADGISPIKIRYSTFMSYFVMFVILSNLITYKLLMKYRY